MKKGDIYVRKGSSFRQVLEPSLDKLYCAKFITMGEACPGCPKKFHMAMARWKESNRETQVDYVKAHKEKLCFNAKSVKFLRPDERYLLGDENGPLRLGENRR